MLIGQTLAAGELNVVQKPMETIDWISRNIRGGNEVEKSTLLSVSNFTLMWALFEGTEAHGESLIVFDELKHIAKRVTDSFPQSDLDTAIDYWSTRYISSNNTNEKFRKLRVKGQENINLVKNTLLGHEVSKTNQIHAILIIIYRLRNNMFHGMKDLKELEKQQNNFDHASTFLKCILESSGRYIYHNA